MADKIRFQEYGIGIFSTITTKSALKKAIKKGCITIGTAEASTATYIQGGEKIVFTVTASEEKKTQLNFQLEVIFEDDFLAIIEKPAGIMPTPKNKRAVIAFAFF